MLHLIEIQNKIFSANAVTSRAISLTALSRPFYGCLTLAKGSLPAYIACVDRISSEKRSHNMAQIKGKDTKPEKLVRSLLHRMGFRFRIHVKRLPGCPDIVLPRYKAVIFVHGCFWHGHEGCKRAALPVTRRDFWAAKITGNKVRDERNIAELRILGYKILIIWQCEMKDIEHIKQRLSAFLTQE